MSDIDEIVTRELEREAAAAGGAPPQSALAPMPEPELAPDPEEQDDGFEAIVARERAREQATDLNINRAMKVEPDQRRSAMSLSEEFNLPLYLIESEREKFEQQYKEKQARQAAARLPALAEELQEPNTAPLVLAEAPYLLDLDESLQPKEIDPPLGEQFGVSLGRGALNTRYDYLGWKIGMKRASIEEREEHRALRAEIKRQSPFKDRPGPLDDIVRVTGTMLPYMGDVAVAGGEGAGVGLVGGAGAGAALGSLGGGVGAVPGAIAGAREGASTGAKAAVLYHLSQLEGGSIYNQLLDISDEIRAETGQEVPEEAIQGLMAAGGITNAMLEGFALGKFAKMFPGGKLLMAKLARTEMKAALTSLARRSTLARVGEKMALGAAAIGTNAIQEGLQGLAPRVAANMLTQTYLNPSVPLTAGLVQGFTEDTIQGLYGGVGIATLGGGASIGTEAVRRTFESRQRLADLDHHVEKADATKMATENPELFRRIVARTTDNRDGDRSVFVAPDMLEAALGETIADLPGLSAQVAEARVTRGDVVIRMEDYLTDLREYHQALRPHVRVGLAGASQQEMEYSEQLEAELAKAEKGREKLTPREQSSERIYDYMFEAATRDLKMSIPEAKAHAANFQAHMTQLAAEVNEDPWQFFEPIAKRLRLEGPAARADVTKPLLDQQLSRIDVERNLETIQNPAGVARQLRFPSYPVLELLKSHGGVNPNSPLGGDLKSMGVTAQSHPGLFQDDGLEALDNLDIENEPVLVGNLRIPDGEWYIAPNDLLDAIERELRGQPLRSEEQLQAIEAVEGPARELERHLLELGVDPRTVTVEQTLELLERGGVHRPEAGEENQAEVDELQEFDPEDDFTTLEQPSANAMKVGGIGRVLPYLTEAEQERVQASLAKGLVSRWGQLNKMVEVGVAAAWSGRVKRGWYKKSAETLQAIFGEDTRQFVALLAADSPQRGVEQNLSETLEMWTAWTDAGRPLDPKTIEALIRPHISNVPSAVIPNAVRVLSTKDPAKNPDLVTAALSGEKVSSFHWNLLGAVDRVTLDTHMAAFFGWGLNFSGNVADYFAVSALIRKVAAVLTERTGETWTPDEVQETIWSWIYIAREKTKEVDPKTGKRRTIQDIVKKEGVTDAEMQAVPDFDMLLAQTKYRQLVEGLGLGGRLTALQRRQARDRGAGAKGRRSFQQEDERLAPDAVHRQLSRHAARIQDYLERSRIVAAAKRARNKARDAAKRAADTGDPADVTAAETLAREAAAAAEEAKAAAKLKAGDFGYVVTDRVTLEQGPREGGKRVVRVYKAPEGESVPPPEFVAVGAPLVDMIETGRLESGITRLRTVEDAAHIAMPLAQQYPQETVVGIFTDRKGNVLRVVQAHIGAVAESMIDPMILLGPGYGLPNATHVFWVHNHPSGDAEPSPADVRVQARLATLTQQTGLRAIPLVVTPTGKASDFTAGVIEKDLKGNERVVGDRRFDIPTSERTRAIQIMQRRYVLPPAGGANMMPEVASASQVIPTVKELVRLGRGAQSDLFGQTAEPIEEGLLFLDVKNRPVAFLPMSAREMQHLRTSDTQRGVGAILQTAHRRNSNTMIVVAESPTKALAKNMVTAGAVSGIRVFDVVDFSGRSSVVSGGGLPKAQQTFYQRMARWFHGTGAEFDRFLAEYIGTGEGTANQGWGFYFTSAESAMRFYAKQEGKKTPAAVSWRANAPLDPSLADAFDYVVERIKHQLDEGIELITHNDIDTAVRYWLDTDRHPGFASALAAYNSGLVSVISSSGRGVGLEVEIPAEDQLLDWRKTLAEQSEPVRHMLVGLVGYRIASDSGIWTSRDAAQAGADALGLSVEEVRLADDMSMSGEDLYRTVALLSRDDPNEPDPTATDDGEMAASLKLLELGIKGHVYTSGHGNENAVIYDPEAVKILTRVFQDADPDALSELRTLQAAIADAVQRGDEAEADLLRGRAQDVLEGLLEQPARGSLSFDPDFQEVVVRLSQARDASTFIHESGHLFLELMLRTAERTDASERLKNNAQAALDWLGAPDRMSITREQHETFARAYEAYLWEGKAPSLALVDTFARFTTFLLRVYRSLTELRVNLDDDIRSVFDRMVASDEAIAEARRVQGFMPAFNEAGESSGMTPEEYASYQVNAQRTYEHHRRKLMRATLDDLEQRKKQEYLEEKKRITQQVILDVNSRPVFRARGWLQTGTVPDGVAAPSIPHKRLDRVALVALKGMGILKVFPPGKYSIWQKEDGYAPETIARVFGFDSADHMLNAFATTSSRQEVIALEVEDRLARRFGDVFRDGRLPAMALEASMTNEQGEFLVAELKALQRNVLTEAERELGQELPLRTIKRSARRQIGETRVRDLRPDRYRSQEQKCALRAAEAIRARDWPTAHAEKMAEVLNHYLAIEAEKAKIRAEKDRRYLRTMSLAPARMRMGKAGHDYLQQIDALLERFKFGPLTKAASIERENLEAWIRKQELAGESVPIDPRIRSEAFRVDWKGMTVEQLSALSDAVHSIEHLAQKKNQLILRKQKRDFAETITTATVSIEQNTVRDVRHLDTADSPIVDGMMKFGRNVHGFHTKLEALFKRLDGGKLGFMWELCFKPFADAEAEEQAWMGELSTKLQTIFAKLREAGGRRPKLFIPELGRSLSFEKRLVIALNQGNEGNKAALLEGKLDGVEWDQQQIDAVLGTLEESDWDAVREIAALVASLKDRAFDLQERLSGVRPESVEAADVVTKFGVYPGWYWPLRADTGRSLIAHKRAEAEDTASMFEGNAFAPMTRTGHLNTRVGFGGQPVLLSLSVLSEHLYNVVHDVTHREALLQVDKVTQNKEVASAIVAAVGREMYLQIRPWLQGIAGERVDAQRTFIDPVLGWLRTGISVSYMGFKVSVMLSQSLGILQAMGPEGVGAVRFTKEMATFLRHPLEARQRVEWAMSLSPALRARLNNFDRDARDAIKRGAFATSRFGELHADYVQFAMHAIGLADMTITVPTWIAAYGRALEEHGDSKAGVERAIAEADSVVRLTMGAGGAKDLAAVQRGGELWRAMTGFYSAISAVYNQWGLQVAAIRDGRVSLAEVANAAMFLWILPAMIQPLLARQSPDDDDEWFEWYFTEIALYPANLVIGARDAAGYIKRKIRGEYADLSLPAIDSLELVVDATYDPLEALVEKGELSRKNMRDMANAVGVLAHLTSRQAVISFEALYDLSANQSRGKVEGLGDLFLTRPPERRARPMSYRPPARKTPPLEAAAPKSTRRQVLRDSEGLIRELVGAGKRTQVVRNASGQIEELVEVNDA